MTEQPETLVILSPGFPANEDDTACIPPQQVFVRSLRRNFPELNIIVLSFQYPFRKDDYQWHGVQVISLNGQNRPGFFRLLTWIRAWRMLRQLRKRHRIVGLFSFWCTECALVGKHFASRHGLKHFIWILGQDARRDNQYIRRIRPKAETLVAMSPFLAETFYRDNGVKPEHIILNGIDERLFPESTGPARPIDILGAGSLSRIKEYDAFVRVVKLVTSRLAEVNTVICGDGPERGKLEKQITGLQLQENISLKGEQPHTEVLRQMQQAKIFVHTCRYEGFGTVFIEALYAGAHVVSFVQPLLKDIKHWHVVQTEEEMAEKVLELLQDPQLSHIPVHVHSMDESARAVMKLFTDGSDHLPQLPADGFKR